MSLGWFVKEFRYYNWMSVKKALAGPINGTLYHDSFGLITHRAFLRTLRRGYQGDAYISAFWFAERAVGKLAGIIENKEMWNASEKLREKNDRLNDEVNSLVNSLRNSQPANISPRQVTDRGNQRGQGRFNGQSGGGRGKQNHSMRRGNHNGRRRGNHQPIHRGGYRGGSSGSGS
eukprot:851008_1